MKFLMLFLALSFTTGCTLHARPFHLRGPAVVVEPTVDVRVRHRHRCRTVKEKDCYRNRYGHKVCKFVRVKRCR